MKTKIGIVIGALLLIIIWIYVALSVWTLEVRETIAGAAAIVALAGLLVSVVGTKSSPKSDGLSDVNKLIETVTAPYISQIKKLEEELSQANKSDLERQKLSQCIDELKEVIKDKEATIRAMEEARQKNTNPSEPYIQAYQLAQKGEIDDALQLLSDERLNKNSKQNANEHILKAQLLTLKNRYQDAEACYIRATEIYPSFDTFLAIGNYYYLQRNYTEAGKYYEACLDKSQDDTEKAMTLNNLAILHRKTNKHEEAAEEYAEALKIYRRLAERNPEAYESGVATTLNNLALLHSDTNKHEEAAEEYAEALKIYRRLAKRNPEAYESDVATTLNNLAILHSDTNKHEEAAEEYAEALQIYRRLAKRNPEAYEPNVAMTLNNLAILHRATNKHEEAAEEYAEALEIYRRLAKQNPDADEPNVAQTLNNLALLHSDTNKHEEAAEEYAEALQIRRRLAKRNPEAYEPDVAETLNNLANLHRDTNKHEEAAEEYAEALKIYEKFAQTSPEAYEPDVAATLSNLALLHSATNQHEEAAGEITEALQIYEKFAQTSPAVYQPHVDRCRLLLRRLKE
ncbi:MAG: tetratricopeptide repeat protein [Prevotellaceae bacterium]|jgi:tetratricopeptide (TPR) repeat protein|nr:tetratricopeptide repeat protein [Prevotellaceae bacterium]